MRNSNNKMALFSPILTILFVFFTACNNESKSEKKNETIVSNLPATTIKDSIDQWVSKVLATYDTLREVDKFLARANHLTDTILKLWSDSLKGKLGNSGDAKKSLFLFIPRFDPIWKNNFYQKEIADKIILRINKLPTDQIKLWRQVLIKAHRDGVEDIWVFGLVTNADTLFSATGYQNNIGLVILKRFDIIPSNAIASLSQVLNTARADAAMDIATSGLFFTDTIFRQQTFDEAISHLKTGIKKNQ